VLYSAYYFSSSAPATLGLAEPLNYGLSIPPGLLRRVGDVEAFCGNWQSCCSSQRVGRAPADCWQTGCKALSHLQETLHKLHHYPTLPVRSTGV